MKIEYDFGFQRFWIVMMFNKGPFYVLAGLGLIALPGVKVLYQTHFVEDEAAPQVLQTKQQAEDSCVRDSVQIAGVWVGCKATSSARKGKKAPRKLQMNSQKAKGSATGSRVIKLN
jgi:hypothetical protein